MRRRKVFIADEFWQKDSEITFYRGLPLNLLSLSLSLRYNANDLSTSSVLGLTFVLLNIMRMTNKRVLVNRKIYNTYS